MNRQVSFQGTSIDIWTWYCDITKLQMYVDSLPTLYILVLVCQFMMESDKKKKVTPYVFKKAMGNKMAKKRVSANICYLSAIHCCVTTIYRIVTLASQSVSSCGKK